MARWRDEDVDEAAAPVVQCWLCGRPMGEISEWHHPVPKSRKGKERVPVHPICHQAIHASFTNAQLERIGPAVEQLRDHPEVAKFLAWVANKAPDFHAPTADRRRR